MEVNYESARFWLTIINMIATLCVFLYMVLTRKSQVNAAKLETFEKEMVDLVGNINERTIRLEERPDHRPDVADLHKRLGGISRDLSEMKGEFNQTSEAVKRMHDYMINRKK